MDDNERQLRDVLQTLTTEQLRFVQIRMYERSDAAAARAMGMSENTVYAWDNKEDVRRAVQLARMDGLNVARERLKRLMDKALDVLDKEMDTRTRRLDAATEVLNRVGLTQPHKVALTDPTGAHEYSGGLADEGRVGALLALYERVRTRAVSQPGDGAGAVDPSAGAADGGLPE